MKVRSVLGAALWVGLWLSNRALALEITNVSHAPEIFDAADARQEVEIRFRLSEAAPIEVLFRDREGLVRATIRSGTALGAGDHAVRWNGRDREGRPLPAEAYRYTVRAGPTGSGETAVWDIESASGREVPKAVPVQWDADTGRIRYVLARPARIVIRVGLQDEGPLLATVVNWRVRAAGEHAERWRGTDASGRLDLRTHPRLKWSLLEYPLPRNAVLIAENPERGGEEHSKRPSTSSVERSPSTDRSVSMAALSDCVLSVQALGVSAAAGAVTVRVDVPERDRSRILAERFEVGFFVDGVLVFENEVGFLPMTWTWRTSAVNPGTHTLTANLWGFRGSMGTASLIVVIPAEDASRSGE